MPALLIDILFIIYHILFGVWGNDEENVYKHAAVAACVSRYK